MIAVVIAGNKCALRIFEDLLYYVTVHLKQTFRIRGIVNAFSTVLFQVIRKNGHKNLKEKEKEKGGRSQFPVNSFDM